MRVTQKGQVTIPLDTRGAGGGELSTDEILALTRR
jgi:bifunctional DNA-binding transcriptional regulator/antitoxin component of YhaV-PrlF toxin-antitoxin module